MKKTLFSFLIPFCLAFSKNSYSHHAMEYIEMESYQTASQGEYIFHVHYDYMVEDQNDPLQDHWELTPGLTYGITDSIMFDVHTHFAKFGNNLLKSDKQALFSNLGPSPFMEALAIALQYRFDSLIPLDMAIAAVYEVPFKRSQELLDGQSVVEGILILSKDIGDHSNICANLKIGKNGTETIKEWAIGAKKPLSADPHGIAAGIEILGNLNGEVAFLPGIYLPLGGPNNIFKTGIKFSENGLKANVTVMYRF